jgi:hypothetical protein
LEDIDLSDLSKLASYELVEKKELPEVDGTGYVLSHKKTKARVLVVENSDSNKVFTIGFRTPPKDDTGVAHIMEHSVLCGSKNFPVKDPFVELCKGSLNTFLNAMTYPDKTVYPVASLNKKDFHNLMHVYLDAVFYPNIYTKEEIMMQEGWHYEVDEESGELLYNGVVYNEMKGVYSNPEQQLFRVIMNSLLPDTAYGFESGGDPAYITDLTRDDFLDFHKKYYHPSNSYIYLYGDMDTVSELEFIDREYLADFDYLDIDSTLKPQPDFDKPVRMEKLYSLSEAEEEKDNTYLSYNVTVGKSTDKKLCIAMGVLDDVLVSMPGAPLKKALVDSGICKDVMSSFDDGILQPQFSIIAKNANPEDEEKFINIINETLSELADRGLDKKSILASVNNFEFKHKEANFGRYPKGLMYGLNAFSTWLYDDTQAFSLFSMNEVYEELKALADTGYFEQLIKEYFVENNNKSYVKLAPKKGLNAIDEQKEKDKLARHKASLDEKGIETIKKLAAHLKEYQSAEDTQEALKTIPLLEIDDIDKKARRISNTFTNVSGIDVVSHDIFTNGISYLGLNFDITDMAYDKLPVVSLLCEIFKYVDTEHYNCNGLASEIGINTGGIGFTTSVVNKKSLDEYCLHFVVNAKMFDENVSKGMELIEEILFTSKIDDKKRLREIIAETRSALKNDMVASGHLTAAGRAVSYISPIGVVKELTEGLDYYDYISDLDDNFEDRYEELAVSLKLVLAELLTKEALIVSYTGKQDVTKLLGADLSRLSGKLNSKSAFSSEAAKPEVKNEGIKTASQVQYVAAAGNFLKDGLEYNGALVVLSTIFSYDYLWLNVRVKGGAYGCMCSFSRSGNAYLTSYRDPNLLETYEIYKKAPEYVKNFNCDDRDMTKYVIGAISKLDAPLTPVSEGNFSFVSWLMGLNDEDLQRERDQVLSCTNSDIQALEPYVRAIIDADTICVIGNEDKVEKVRDSFKNIISFL